MFGLLTCIGLLALLGVGTLRRPAVALAAVLCLYGLKQWGQNSSPLLVEHRTWVNFAVAALIIVGLLRKWSSQQNAGAFSSPWVIALSLYAYAGISLLWTPDLQTALEQWTLQVPYLLIVAVLAPLLLDSAADVRRACDWTVVVGGVLCALALFFGKWGTRGLLLNGNIFESETNPLALASLGGTVSLAAMISIVPATSWYKRVLFVPAIPIGLATILRSGSRGQLVAVIVAASVGLMLASEKKNLKAWLMVIIVVLLTTQVGFWIWDQLGVDSARWTNASSTEDAEGRLKMAVALLAAAASNPMTLLGGLGNSSSFHYVGFYPHVAPLEVLAEEGLIGLGMYCAFLIATLGCIFKVRWQARQSRDRDEHVSLVLLTTLFVFEWLLTFKQGTLLSSVYAIAYASVLGRLSTIKQQTAAADSESMVHVHGTPLPNLMR